MIVNIEKMRESRRSPQVALTKYHIIRGKRPDTLIFVFEGEEDLPYYETIVKRVRSDIYFSPIIANGKDQVLGLRELVSKQKTYDTNIRFFIDKDFDGTKGYNKGHDLYVSEGYSIENHLVSAESLKCLLQSEYKCHLPEDDADIDKIISQFYRLLNSFFDEMLEANLAIFHARRKKIKLRKIDNRVSEYLDINFNHLSKSEKCHYELIGWPDNERKDIQESKPEFLTLDPKMEWRGKFIFDFFTRVLKILKDDRTSNQPKIFSRKSGVKYDPNGEIIRSLTTLSKTPETLERFIKGIPE